MLSITVNGVESFDDDKQEFVTTEDTGIELEHSLVSLSKWESKWEKPFLTNDSKTSEEVLDYINCMSIKGDIPLEVLYRLKEADLKAINAYIEAKMTATWFTEIKKKAVGIPEVVTSEIIYHWLVALQIPFECEHWHLNRLITLVKTINEKNKAASDTKKKAPTRADLDNRRALMEKRRKESGDNG